MKKPIELIVNGAAVRAEVEPRLQLADFLRDHLLLTGTHLGCEHGVCGACTVQLDGAPARSCIAYAAACDGAEVRTIEGFDNDPVMAQLREAFSTHHALQCGYCTPGMLVTARDIVLRLPLADEARIREELSGNLCRCTGYVGIVRAIQSVLAERKAHASPGDERSSFDSAALRSGRTGDERSSFDSAALRSGRTGGGLRAAHEAPATIAAASLSTVRPERRPVAPESKDERQTPPPAPSEPRSAAAAPGTNKPQTTLHQSFSVDHPRDKVWEFFGRLGEVTTCLPGATVLGTPTDDHVEIKLRIKVGPIVPEFEGAADVVRDRSNYSGTISGSARDTHSSSATRGEIRYVLLEEKAATRVELDVSYTLTGVLAQFSRSGIVQDIAKRMTLAFAQNLQARLAQGDSGGIAARRDQPPAVELDAGSLFFSALWTRIKAFFRPRR